MFKVQQHCKLLFNRYAKLYSSVSEKIMESHRARITVEFHDNGFAVIRMRNNENRINPGFLTAFNDALDKVESNKSCRAVITTGEGKFYSNGLDLDNISRDQATMDKTTKGLQTILCRLLTFPVLTIAAVNGHCYAGGAFLAISHDLRIMREDRGWMCWNEVHITIPFSGVLMALVVNKLPKGRILTQAIALGRRFTAQEAMAATLVDATANEESLITEAKALASKFLPTAGFDRHTLQSVKQEINKSILEENEAATKSKL